VLGENSCALYLGARTHDLHICSSKSASWNQIPQEHFMKKPHAWWGLFMEGPVGFEPTTRGLKGRCSNLLSYGPAISGQENNSLYYL
jgi:hypothetical protein